MILTWTPQPSAARYRVVLRDVGENTIVHKSGALDEARYELDDRLLEPGREYEWRSQWRPRRDATWRDIDPYLHLAPPAEHPQRTSELTWEGPAEEIHRVIIRDETVDRIVAKHAVRGTAYMVEWSRLNPLHMLRWRAQRHTADGWADVNTYRALSPPPEAMIAVRREREPGPPDLTRGEQLLFLLTVDTEGSMRLMADPDPRRLYDEQVFGDIGGARGLGIGLHMDLAEEFGFRCCFFLDILLELSFGREGMERTVDAILSRGHEIQLHLHTAHLSASSDERLRAATMALYGDDPEAFRIALDAGVELFAQRVGKPPVAYRSGGYNLHESFFAELARAGIAIDSSLNAFKNVRVPEWMRGRTQPFVHDGVLEVPVSWHVREAAGVAPPAVRQFSPHVAERQESFTGQPTSGRAHPLTSVYVSHSYQLMESRPVEHDAARPEWQRRLAERAGEEAAARYRLPAGRGEFLDGRPDEDRVTLLRRTLGQLAARQDVRGVTFEELAAAGHGPWAGREDEPADPVPVWSTRANRATTWSVRAFSAPRLELLESGAAAPVAAGDGDPLADLVERSGLAWDGADVLARGLTPATAGLLRDRGARVEEVAGGLPERDATVAAVVAGGLHGLPPVELLEWLRRCHDLLEPGGHLVTRVETFFSDAGGRLSGLRTPGAHLLFAEHTAAELNGVEVGAGSAFCAATFMTTFRRAGFEFAALERALRPADDPFLQRWAQKLRFYDELERRTTALDAVLRRPTATPLEDLQLVSADA